jgi:hypothetical protein
MAYDPLTGRYTPDPTPTPFGQAGSKDPFEALLARLGKRTEELTKLEEIAKVATNPQRLSAGDLRRATAEDRDVATQARRDLQQATLELNAGGGGGGGDTGDTGGTAAADLAARQEAARIAEEKRRAGQSAYDLLYGQFAQYGMGALVEPLKQFIQDGISPAELTLRLRDTDPYKKRFAANAARIQKGLSALDEATYIDLEDQYQNVMRNYGLPTSYYTRGDMGRQEGFEKFISNDVSATELEDRIVTAQKRVMNANPEVAFALKNFYPDITNGDILAYTLDPKNGLDAIKRKVTAAEIGGAALSQGLTTSLGGAEGLAAYGITKDQAQQGYQAVAGILPRGSQLADIYGEQPYTQQTAEAEVFGTQGSAEARKRREKLVSLEQAAFGGSAGVGALGRDKAIYGGASGQAGLY